MSESRPPRRQRGPGGISAPAELVAEHLLATEPASDAWVTGQLVSAARAAARAGASESAAAYLRRTLAEPPAPEKLSGVLLELGHAEFNARHPDALCHLEQAAAAAAEGPARAAGPRAACRPVWSCLQLTAPPPSPSIHPPSPLRRRSGLGRFRPCLPRCRRPSARHEQGRWTRVPMLTEADGRAIRAVVTLAGAAGVQEGA